MENITLQRATIKLQRKVELPKSTCRKTLYLVGTGIDGTNAIVSTDKRGAWNLFFILETELYARYESLELFPTIKN